jgi:hypothetical protein
LEKNSPRIEPHVRQHLAIPSTRLEKEVAAFDVFVGRRIRPLSSGKKKILQCQ